MICRKKHEAEYKERLRLKQEREARRQRERQLREETRQMEREAQAERDARRASRAKRRQEVAKASYDERWAKLLERQVDEDAQAVELSFEDIPWPVAPPTDDRVSITVDDISLDAISSFLLSTEQKDKQSGEVISRKDILRTTMLRFHPDKFEARIFSRVRDADKSKVKEVADVVVRALNALMKENSDKSL